MIDELLEKVGLKYEDLSSVEKETLNTWVDTLQKGQLSLEKVRDYVSSMKQAVEQELAKADLGTKQDTFLKARLRNYMLLESLFTTPEKAQEQIENAIQGMVGRK